ncbi:hypothetical protein [Streptomyces sp. NBC_00829]|uniref:hypothetical protein n=1 Tax=Streptomyces sp. NBC_00829 TaxID=2903679 RepID=UPI00386DFC56|nr:hypothetical protein OG293_25400 [Streptomyces sp. NBC_00829]
MARRQFPMAAVGGTPVALGAGRAVGEGEVLTLPEGLAGGVVGEAEALGRALEGRGGAGLASTGGLVGAAGLWEAGDSR